MKLYTTYCMYDNRQSLRILLDNGALANILLGDANYSYINDTSEAKEYALHNINMGYYIKVPK